MKQIYLFPNLLTGLFYLKMSCFLGKIIPGAQSFVRGAHF